MKFLLVVLLLVGLAEAFCPDGYSSNAQLNRCYKYVTSELTFADAQQFCQKNNDILINVLNDQENSFVAKNSSSVFSSNQVYWIGVTNNKWQNVDGTPSAFQNWASGEPGSDVASCVFSTVSTGIWYHSNCQKKLPFVCTRAVTPKCPSNQTYFSSTDSCYYVGSSDTFSGAETKCSNLNGHLTSIHSEEENNFVRSLTTIGGVRAANQMTWIGLRFTGREWLWTDGSKRTYTNWIDGTTPTDNNKPCATLLQDEFTTKNSTIGKWNPVTCTYVMRAFVCKSKPLW